MYDVPSFELCLKLKEIGLPQQGVRWYNRTRHLSNVHYIHIGSMDDDENRFYVYAPTKQELINILLSGSEASYNIVDMLAREVINRHLDLHTN